MRRAMFVLGRAIYGGFFAYSGLNHFMNSEQMSGYAQMKGTPAPEAAVAASGAMMLAGGLSIATGVKPRFGLGLIAACLVPVTLKIHNYWTIDDPMQRQSEMVNFTKNVALIGAALAMMEIEEPWEVSPARIGSDHVTYPRLSAENLRALPA